MALLNLIFNRPERLKIQVPDAYEKRLKVSKRTLLIIDASNEIQHQNRAEPTEHPVEQGIDVSDHVDVQPKVLTFNGIVSNAPINLQEAAVGNVAGAVGGVVSGFAGGAAGFAATGAVATLGGLLLNQRNANRAVEAHNAMEEIMAKKIPCTLITGLRAYENMILTDYTPTETTAAGKSLMFSATFTEIRIVQSRKVKIPKEFIQRELQASALDVSDEGKKVTQDASTDNASLLSRLTGVGA